MLLLSDKFYNQKRRLKTCKNGLPLMRIRGLQIPRIGEGRLVILSIKLLKSLKRLV